MQRANAIRQSALFLGVSAWVFLILSLGSFHATDWPSHEVFPYPAIQNVCGSVGAWVAYYCFLGVGQGVFPILFFSGVCLALLVFNSRVSDVWLRVIGLLQLSTAFAATVHHLKPGSLNGLPEGHGGLLGIATSSFLQSHFNVWGTRLVLLTAILIGLLLAADDLVLRMPGYANMALANVRERVPSLPRLPAFKFNFPELPKLPALPRFVTKDSIQADARLESLKKAETMVPDSMEVPYNVALVYQAQGRSDEAAKILQDLLKKSIHLFPIPRR